MKIEYELQGVQHSETLVLSDFPVTNPSKLPPGVDKNDVSSFATTPSGLLYASLVDVDIPTGNLGASDLSGYIVICNYTSPDASESFLNTGGGAFGIENPWYVFNSTGAYKDLYNRTAFTPVSQYIDVLQREQYNVTDWDRRGASWYLVPPQKKKNYGTYLNNIGMTTDILGDDINAETVCQGGRHTGVPGWIPRFTWTYQDRVLDNGGVQERNLRDFVVPINVPLQILGRLQDNAGLSAMDESIATPTDWYNNEVKTCQDFMTNTMQGRNQDLSKEWVLDNQGGAKCSLPLQWINGGFFMSDYMQQTGEMDNVAVEVLTAFAGTLVSVDTAISPGKFCRSQTNADVTSSTSCNVSGAAKGDEIATVCTVSVGTEVASGGSMQVKIDNVATGGAPAIYEVFVECADPNLVQTNIPKLTLAASQISSPITVSMAYQINTVAGDTQDSGGTNCTLKLVNPSLPGISLDIVETQCVVSFYNPSTTMPYNYTSPTDNFCDALPSMCMAFYEIYNDAVKHWEDENSSWQFQYWSEVFWILVTISILFLLIVIPCFWVGGSEAGKTSRELKAQYKALNKQ